MDYRCEAPDIIKEFLSYHEVVKGHSAKTVDEYYLDIRMFLRFLKKKRGLAQPGLPFDEIPAATQGLSSLPA
jgi:site-specific recombinase XerD